jgi:UDPglucose 6-dehydrogenase
MIGVGYVGLVSGACFADFGHQVICVDNDETRIQNLRKGIVPFFEPGLSDLIERNVQAKRLRFTTAIRDGIQQSRVIFIAVGTPSRPDRDVDLTYVEQVAREISHYMNGYKVIVDKSTVPVGTARWVADIIRTNRAEPHEFDVVSNPEFLREGSAIEDFMRPNRVVVGAESEKALNIVCDIYDPLYLIETPIVRTNLETAELIKYATNAFLATKISFINEMANLCERVGADVKMLAKGMGLDKRIGPKFLHAGGGYGGSCFPKDTDGLIKIAEKAGYDLRIVQATVAVNRRQKQRFLEKVLNALGDPSGKTAGVLGLAFKPNTDDMREALSTVVIPGLVEQGVSVKAYDPVAMEQAKQVLPPIEYCNSPEEVAQGADILILLTEWNEFRTMDISHLAQLLKSPTVIDARNMYEPARMRAMGINYICIGRS